MSPHTKFTFYDLETTGTNPFFDVPTQFACVTADEAFNVIEEVNWRARAPSYVLPAPGALTTTNVGYASIQSAPHSFYELTCKIKAKIEEVQPSTFIAHNGLAFDENFLRTSFYRNLHNPYLTQFNGNDRLDTLILSQAVHILCPGMLNVPTDPKTGKPTFRLGGLAAANGFKDHEAHDALSDVKAMLHLTRTIQANVPGVWKLASSWCSKASMTSLLKSGAPIVAIQWNAKGGKATVRVVKPLCPLPELPSDWIVVDLGKDVSALSAKETLYANLLGKKEGKLLSTVRANKMNIVLPLRHPLAGPFVGEVSKVEALADAIVVDDVLKANAVDAWNVAAKEYDDAIHVEEQIYSGGFFPSPDDVGVAEKFHKASPKDRVVLAGLLKDSRARALARRLIAEEWPDVCAPELVAEVQQQNRSRLMVADKTPWTTAHSAIHEIDTALAIECPAHHAAILNEYRQMLREKYFLQLAAE